MTCISTYLSVLMLNVNRLNSTIKSYCLTNKIQKEDSTICSLQDIHLIYNNKHRLRVKGWKKIYQAKGPPKEAGVAIFISEKVDFKPTLIK
jgi:exonuclease III